MRVLKGRYDDALYTSACVKFFLRSDFVRRAFFQKTARATVRAFGVLAENDEINVCFATILLQFDDGDATPVPRAGRSRPDLWLWLIANPTGLN